MPERLLFWGLTALVMLSPLPFGSNRPWSWHLLALLVGLAALGWSAVALRRGQVPVPPLRVLPVALPFALALAWAALQASGWTPVTLDHPAWTVLAESLGRPVEGRLSVMPAAAWDGLARLLCYGLVFWLALQLCRDRRRARLALRAVVVAATLFALYGLVAHLSGSNSILWFQKWSYEDYATGPFVNRNSFATYLGIGLVGGLALLIEAWLGAVEFTVTRRHRLHRTIELAGRQAVPILGLIVMASALLLTGSRAGLAATLAGLAVLVAQFAWARRDGPLLRGLVMVLLLGMVGLLLVSGEATTQRLGDTGASLEARGRVYEATLQAIGTAPLIGTGLGSFDLVFQQFQPSSVHGNWDKAHNTYLENALELGVPAAALLALGPLLAALHCLRGTWRRRRDGVFPAVGLAASVLVAAHALVDFSLQIPAVAVTWCFLLGMGSAQAWRRDDLRRSAPAGGGPQEARS